MKLKKLLWLVSIALFPLVGCNEDKTYPTDGRDDIYPIKDTLKITGVPTSNISSSAQEVKISVRTDYVWNLLVTGKDEEGKDYYTGNLTFDNKTGTKGSTVIAIKVPENKTGSVITYSFGLQGVKDGKAVQTKDIVLKQSANAAARYISDLTDYSGIVVRSLPNDGVDYRAVTATKDGKFWFAVYDHTTNQNVALWDEGLTLPGTLAGIPGFTATGDQFAVTFSYTKDTLAWTNLYVVEDSKLTKEVKEIYKSQIRPGYGGKYVFQEAEKKVVYYAPGGTQVYQCNLTTGQIVLDSKEEDIKFFTDDWFFAMSQGASCNVYNLMTGKKWTITYTDVFKSGASRYTYALVNDTPSNITLELTAYYESGPVTESYLIDKVTGQPVAQ